MILYLLNITLDFTKVRKANLWYCNRVEENRNYNIVTVEKERVNFIVQYQLTIRNRLQYNNT